MNTEHMIASRYDQGIIRERTFKETLDALKERRFHATQKLVDIFRDELKKHACREDCGESIDVIDDEEGEPKKATTSAFENTPEPSRDFLPRKSQLPDSITSSTKPTRVNYTTKQLQTLCEAFGKNKYPDVEMREQLSSVTGIPEKKIKIWFQNRRTRSTKAKKAQSTDAFSRNATRNSSTTTPTVKVTPHHGPMLNFMLPPQPPSFVGSFVPQTSYSSPLLQSNSPSNQTQMPQLLPYLTPHCLPQILYPYRYMLF